MPATSQRLRAYVFLLINTLCWGASFVIVEPALQFTSPYQFLFYRFTLAGVLTIPLLWFYLKRPGLQKHIWKILCIELVGTVLYMALLYEGLARSTSIETSLLGTTTPLFIILACVFFLHERQTKREWFGLAISFSGVLLIAVLPLLDGKVDFTQLSFSGNALIILANCLAGMYAVLIKKFHKKIPPLFVATLSFWLGAVAFGLISFASSQFSASTLFATFLQDWHQPSIVFATVYMAIFGSIIGLSAYIKGQSLIEASEASMFYYLQPLVYLPLGILILGEHLEPLHMLGLVCILVGVGISELR